MRMKYIALGVFVVLLLLFLRGSSISNRCGQIGTCSACWQNIPVTVSGPLCPDGGTCFADEQDQQHNAWIDVLYCACDLAKEQGFSDRGINRAIEETVSSIKNVNVTAQELCGQPELVLTKRQYG